MEQTVTAQRKTPAAHSSLHADEERNGGTNRKSESNVPLLDTSFGAVSGVNTQGPQNNGRYPQNGGAMPSKGVGQVMGVQNGFGGYPTKGLGYGGAATGISSTNGAKYNGYGAAARTQGGAAMKGYGAAAGVFNGHRGKPQGYNSLAGITQGGPANKGNGNTAYQGAQNGYGTKSGQKAINGPARRPSNGAGLHGQAGAKPMKGYGRPPYGTGMGAFRGMGPAQAGHQGTAYGSNGYGAKNMGGYRPNGGLGAGAGAGSGLGSRYGNGGMKGPKPGYGDVAGGANEQATKHGGGTRGPIVNGAMSNGYGYGMGGANKPAKPGYGGNGYGAKPNGYNMNRAGIIRPQPGYTNGAGSMKPQPGYTNGAGSMKPQPGYTNGAGMGAFGGQTKGYGSAAAGAGATKGNGAKNNGQRASGAALGGYGNKLNGYGVPGQSAGAGNAGYGISSGKSNSVGALGGPGLKGLLSAAQPTAAPPQGYAPQGYAPQGFVPQLSLSQGGAPVGPESTGALQGRGTPDQYQKLQGKVFSPQATAGPALGPQYSLESTAAGPTPLPALMGSGGKSSKVSGAAVTQSSGALQPSAVLPQGAGGMTTKGQGAVPPDCGPSGVPNGQWMKIPRPEYGTYAGAGSSPHTKGYGAGVAGPSGYSSKTNGFGAAAGGYSNGGATPSQGTRAYAGTGQNNGFGAGLGYPYGGKPGYGQGSYLGAGYGDAGKSQSGNVGGVQPDYASLQGQGVPSVQGKSGMASKPSPYTGELLVPGGIDGINRFQPQAAGYGKVGSAYGGMGGLPQNPKFGIGGLQFGGNPSAANGAGKYGSASGGSYGPATRGKSGKYGSANGQQHLNLGNAANTPGKYGYGRMPYEIQTARQNPKVKSTSKHGSAYQPESAAMGQSGKATGQYDNLGGSQIPYTPQAFGAGGVAKSSGKYGAQNGYKSQHLETSTVRSEEASLPYDSLPVESATGAKSYVKGESPTPAAAVEGASVDRFDNVGYISGQVQPEVVALPAAPTSQPSVPYPSAVSYLPVDAAVTAYGGAKDTVDSAPVTESQVASQGLEQTDDVQQMPQQIHIQQQLKLHFHPQGGNDGKYDLNGFFGNANGNSGYKG